MWVSNHFLFRRHLYTDWETPIQCLGIGQFFHSINRKILKFGTKSFERVAQIASATPCAADNSCKINHSGHPFPAKGSLLKYVCLCHYPDLFCEGTPFQDHLYIQARYTPRTHRTLQPHAFPTILPVSSGNKWRSALVLLPAGPKFERCGVSPSSSGSFLNVSDHSNDRIEDT